MKKRIHIIPRSNKWALKKEGLRVSKIFPEKQTAIDKAKSYPEYEIIVHKKDGTVQELIST
jgi:hypothetical protein